MDYIKTEYKIKPAASLKILRSCSGCGQKRHYINTGNFRVNANGNRLDVWLIYQCEKCKHTYNLSVYERIRPTDIPAEKYKAFLANDKLLALSYGTSLEFFQKNKAQPDINILEYTYEKLSSTVLSTDAESNLLVIYNPFRLKIRMDKLLSEILDISRSRLQKLSNDNIIFFKGNYTGEYTEVSYSSFP